MSHALNFIVKESIKELKGLLKKQPEHLRDRIRMLIELRCSEEALSKRRLAQILGVNQNSIQSWRTMYQKGGLTNLLTYNRGGNKRSMINPEIHKKIEIRLKSPTEAFTSYEELRKWIDENFIPGINYHTVNKYVKRKFGAKLKVARKSHVKKDEQAVKVFKKTSVDSGRKHRKQKE